MVEATQFREASTHVSKPPYEPFEGIRTFSANVYQQNRVRHYPRREVAEKSRSLDLLRDTFKLRSLPIESGPLWRGRRKCVGQPRDVGSPFPRQLDRPISGLKTFDVPGKAGLSSSGACTRRTAEKRSTMERRNVHSSLSAIEFLTKRLNYSGRKCGPLVPAGNPRACGRPAQCHGRIHRTNLTKPPALKVSSALITRTSPMCLCRPVIRRRRNPWHWLPVVALSKAPVADQKLRFSEFRTRKRCS
jgi:hypothetical protein